MKVAVFRQFGFSLYIFIYSYIYIYVYIFYIYIYILYAAVSNRKQKPRRFPLLRLPFAHRKRKFVVCPFVDEETNKSCLFAQGLNGLAYLCALFTVT